MISITILFLTYAIHSFFTYDLTIKEGKKTTLLRNQAQANNIMQDLDKYIDQRIKDFQSIAEMRDIQSAVIESNHNFDPNLDIIELDSPIDATMNVVDGKNHLVENRPFA